jgi:hypothetical protein
VLTLFAILLTAPIRLASFAIDTGYIALAKTRMQRTADAAALAGAEMTAVVPGQTVDPAAGIIPGAPLLPYTMQANYYYAAMGQTNLIGVDGKKIPSNQVVDNYAVKPATFPVTAGSDGVNKVLLFGDKINNGVSAAPGNWGSINIGSGDNAAGTLERQSLDGPTTEDFADPAFVAQVNPLDGALYVSFYASGDPGVTTSLKTTLEAISGRPRIIPLYDTKTGTGSTTVYHIVAYAGVVITKVDFTGNPKSLWVQPAFVVSNKVTPITSDDQATTDYGVYTPPKLVIP